MRRLITLLVLGAWLAPIPVMVGCDDTLEHKKTVEVKDNGQTKVEEKKVTESPNGTITKTEEKKVSNP
jgi:hypothetical protein